MNDMEGNKYTFDQIIKAMKAIGLDSEVAGNLLLTLTKLREKSNEKNNGDPDEGTAGPRIGRSKTYPLGYLCPVCGYMSYSISMKNG